MINVNKLLTRIFNFVTMALVFAQVLVSYTQDAHDLAVFVCVIVFSVLVLAQFVYQLVVFLKNRKQDKENSDKDMLVHLCVASCNLVFQIVVVSLTFAAYLNLSFSLGF